MQCVSNMVFTCTIFKSHQRNKVIPNVHWVQRICMKIGEGILEAALNTSRFFVHDVESSSKNGS